MQSNNTVEHGSDKVEDKSTCFICKKRIFGYDKAKGHWNIEPHDRSPRDNGDGTSTHVRFHNSCITKRRER